MQNPESRNNSNTSVNFNFTESFTGLPELEVGVRLALLLF